VGGELWLSCPDMEKICRHYLNDGGVGLLNDRRSRFPKFNLQGMPPSDIVNRLFNQHGEHKNLFDFKMLSWILSEAGFSHVKLENEQSFISRFPEFPQRNDDYQSIYVSAKAKIKNH
jgi:hypothetical protein